PAIPNHPRSKRPVGDGWEQQRPTDADLDRLFPPDEHRNVGLLLGEPADGLTDIDLDAREAVAVAPAFLPHTDMVSGRPNNLRLHFWYRAAGLENEDFLDPDPGDREPKLVEIRSTGRQTVVAPSVHPDDGDVYQWHSFGPPA